MPAWLDAILCWLEAHTSTITFALGLWAGACFF